MTLMPGGKVWSFDILRKASRRAVKTAPPNENCKGDERNVD